mgnify:CR=1 FL=1
MSRDRLPRIRGHSDLSRLACLELTDSSFLDLQNDLNIPGHELNDRGVGGYDGPRAHELLCHDAAERGETVGALTRLLARSPRMLGYNLGPE